MGCIFTDDQHYQIQIIKWLYRHILKPQIYQKDNLLIFSIHNISYSVNIDKVGIKNQ
jgi:hypothetical protein